MNTPTEHKQPLVGRLAGNVVLSLTPHRANVLATALWMADRTGWLDQLAEDLSAAADQADLVADESPRGTAQQPPRPSTTGTLFAALAHDVEIEIEVARRLEAAASQAALVAFEAVASAAERTAHAAEAASSVQAMATARSAAAIADTVRQTATEVRLRADEEADRVAKAASILAAKIALAPSGVHDDDAAARATAVAAGVSAAAVAIAQDVARHATVVARAAADAAMEAAAAAADAAMALELTVRSTAVEVQSVAALTARRVAGETEKAAGAVLAAR